MARTKRVAAEMMQATLDALKKRKTTGDRRGRATQGTTPKGMHLKSATADEQPETERQPRRGSKETREDVPESGEDAAETMVMDADAPDRAGHPDEMVVEGGPLDSSQDAGAEESSEATAPKEVLTQRVPTDPSLGAVMTQLLDNMHLQHRQMMDLEHYHSGVDEARAQQHVELVRLQRELITESRRSALKKPLNVPKFGKDKTVDVRAWRSKVETALRLGGTIDEAERCLHIGTLVEGEVDKGLDAIKRMGMLPTNSAELLDLIESRWGTFSAAQAAWGKLLQLQESKPERMDKHISKFQTIVADLPGFGEQLQYLAFCYSVRTINGLQAHFPQVMPMREVYSRAMAYVGQQQALKGPGAFNKSTRPDGASGNGGGGSFRSKRKRGQQDQGKAHPKGYDKSDGPTAGKPKQRQWKKKQGAFGHRGGGGSSADKGDTPRPFKKHRQGKDRGSAPRHGGGQEGRVAEATPGPQ